MCPAVLNSKFINRILSVEAYVIWIENTYTPEKIFAFVSCTFHGGIWVWEFPKDHGYTSLRELSQTSDSSG